MLSRVFLLPALVWAFIASAAADPLDGPPRPFTLMRAVGPSVFLDYYPTDASGVSILHFSDDLLNLRATNADLLEVAAGSGPITFDITSFVGGERGFFAVTEFPGLSAADFEADHDDPLIVEVPPTYNLETLTALPWPLTTSTPLPVHFRILDGTTNSPLSIDGSVLLELRTAGGAPVSFAYTLTPNTLPMSAGVVNGTVVLTTDGPLDDAYLAVAGVNPASAARGTSSLANAGPPTIGSNGLLGEEDKELADYLNTVAGWHYPMSSVKPLAGCFGEWRPGANNPSGRPHFGMDLATVAGTSVYPVKRGVVSWAGSLGADGQYMVVVHGDGTASRYLHVIPARPVHAVVETSDLIARTADIAADHLHLELRSGATPAATAGAYRTFGAFPGAAFDPGVQNTGFDLAPIQNGVTDTNAPQIKALYLWTGNPKTDLFDAGAPGNMQPYSTSAVRTLVAQIVDKEGASATSGYLVPAHFDFAVEDPATQDLTVRDSFDYSTEAEARKLFQDSAASFPNFGYVRRVGNILPLRAAYQYWFKWDTAALYTNQELGPRKVRFTASDRAGHSTAQTFTFGPEIIQPGSQTVDAAAPNGTTFTVTAKSFMGPFPAAQMAQSAGPRDELTFSFLGNTTSWDAFFIDPTNGNAEVPTLKWTFIGDSSGVKEDTIQVRVKKKPGAATPTAPEIITIKATSGVFPGVAHKMDVLISADDGDFALIPAGPFSMGDALDGFSDAPVHTVTVSTFSIARTHTTKAQWDTVYAWAVAHGYSFTNAGSGKAADHPVQSVNWFDMLKWCNARSEMQGRTPCYYTDDGQTVVYRSGLMHVTNAQVKWGANGYRLPTEAEWEKAARGGLSGQRFPWGATITHAQANYYSDANYGYDVSPTRDYHPTYAVNGTPYTSPVGAFAPNGYGLRDMAGNVWQWCWDWYGSSYYSTSPSTDPQGPQGPPLGWTRVVRGCSWAINASACRTAFRYSGSPVSADNSIGFRPVRR